MKNRKITFEQKRQKGSKRIIQAISDAFFEELEGLNLAQYPSDYYIFGYSGVANKTICHADFFRKKHRAMLDILGINKDEYKIYNWKHTGASLLFVALDYDILRIKKHLGHTDVKTTMSYIGKYHELSGDDRLIEKAPKFGA